MKIRHLITVLLLSLSVSAHALEDAENAMKEWRPDIALTHLKANEQTDNPHWHRLTGSALAALGESEAALEHLEKAVALAPEDAESHWYLLQGLTAQLDDSGAMGMLRTARQIRRTLETAVELDPDNPEYRYGLMQYYIGAPGVAGGSQRKARQQGDVLAEMDPRWGEAAEALFLLDDGDHEAGLRKLLLAWDEGEGPEQVAMPIVFNAQGQQDWHTAQRTLEQFLARRPGQPTALYQLGRTAAQSGQNLGAGLEALQQYAELPHLSRGNPSRAAAFWRMGEIHYHGGDTELARRAWEQSLELDPAFEEARTALRGLDQSIQGGV